MEDLHMALDCASFFGVPSLLHHVREWIAGNLKAWCCSPGDFLFLGPFFEGFLVFFFRHMDSRLLKPSGSQLEVVVCGWK